MKKYASIILILLIMLIPFREVYAKKTTTEAGTKVNFYVFYSDGCPKCANLHKYISEILSKDKKHNYMYNLVDLEVSSSSINLNLMALVSDKFNLADEKRNQVPLYVIGEQYILGFSLEESPDLIVDALEKAYRENQTDIVASLGSGTVTNTQEEIKEEDEKNNDTTGIIILSIVGIFILAIIYSSIKNKNKINK